MHDIWLLYSTKKKLAPSSNTVEVRRDGTIKALAEKAASKKVVLT
jgi:hypothetical protein